MHNGPPPSTMRRGTPSPPSSAAEHETCRLQAGSGRRKSMKFRKFGKTVLTAALSSAIVFSLSSCVRSFTVGYLYVTGTVTSTPSGNGIISAYKIDNNNGKLTLLHGFPLGSGGANPNRIVLLNGGNFVYVLNQGVNSAGNT